MQSSPAAISETAGFEPEMRARVPGAVYSHVAGGAHGESTVRHNVEAMDAIALRPRADPVDPGAVDPSITLLGRRIPYPVLVAPTSGQIDIHPEGERATYRAATRYGMPFGVSQFGLPLGRIAPEAEGHLWVQLFPESPPSRVRDALAVGAEALILTVDSPYQPNNERITRWVRDHRRLRSVLRESALEWIRIVRGAPLPGPADPTGAPQPRFQGSRADMLADLCATAGLPVLVKGILAEEDAEIAIRAGAAGIVVSNHGGRVLDGCCASIEALPAVVARVAGRVPVLMDSGIRRGSDVLKACALGASAVLVGRPVLWGLGAFGEAGVARVLEILTAELVDAMARLGVRSLAEVDQQLVRNGPA